MGKLCTKDQITDRIDSRNTAFEFIIYKNTSSFHIRSSTFCK
mgnify:CR=1 FL=1